MVPYNLEGTSRRGVHYVLAIVSASLAAAASELLTSLSLSLVAPSGLMIYGLLFLAYDKFLWKIPIIIRLTGLPNISGKWIGIGDVCKTNLDECLEPTEMTVIVSQTWTRINLVLSTSFSISKTTMASLDCSDVKFPTLNYNFSKLPTNQLEDINQATGGSSVVTFCIGDNQKLRGTWYNEAGWYGKLDLETSA